MKRRFHLVAIVYCGWICDSDLLETIKERMVHGCKSDLPHDQCIMFDDLLIGTNPWPGTEETSIVFFTNPTDGRIQVAVGLKGQCCLLKEQHQLVELHNDTVQVIERIKKEDNATTQGLKNAASLASWQEAPHYSCAFDFVDLEAQSHNDLDSLLTFDNGVNFKHSNNGSGFTLIESRGPSGVDKEKDLKFSRAWAPEGIHIRNRHGLESTWSLEGDFDHALLVLSSARPYAEIFDEKNHSI